MADDPIAPEPAAPRTRMLGAIALMFAVTGMIVPVVPSALAVIVGWIAVKRSRGRDRRGYGLAVAAIALGAFGIFLGSLYLANGGRTK